jgi:16S rRNA (cytidine1402-2'-O)-methyltransferase
MADQPSSRHHGILYVVATPIGNLNDITLRAIETLKQVDLIAAEDTRHTRRLLNAHGIDNQMVSYHDHNERQRTPELIAKLERGTCIALVSDAGTPSVSDPGYRLVAVAATLGLRIVPIPGVSAAVAALSVCGLPTNAFTFVGFPVRKKNQRLSPARGLAGVAAYLDLLSVAPTPGCLSRGVGSLPGGPDGRIGPGANQIA